VGSHGGGITSGMYASMHWSQVAAPGKAQWAIRIGCRGSVGNLFVCLLATLGKNFQMDLHEIFREGWQWANEQMIKFW